MRLKNYGKPNYQAPIKKKYFPEPVPIDAWEVTLISQTLAHIAPAEEPIAEAFVARAFSNPGRKWMRFTHSVVHLTNLLYHIPVFTMAVSGTAVMGSKPKLIVFDLGKNLVTTSKQYNVTLLVMFRQTRFVHSLYLSVCPSDIHGFSYPYMSEGQTLKHNECTKLSVPFQSIFCIFTVSNFNSLRSITSPCGSTLSHALSLTCLSRANALVQHHRLSLYIFIMAIAISILCVHGNWNEFHY